MEKKKRYPVHARSALSFVATFVDTVVQNSVLHTQFISKVLIPFPM